MTTRPVTAESGSGPDAAATPPAALLQVLSGHPDPVEIAAVFGALALVAGAQRAAAQAAARAAGPTLSNRAGSAAGGWVSAHSGTDPWAARARPVPPRRRP